MELCPTFAARNVGESIWLSASQPEIARRLDDVGLPIMFAMLFGLFARTRTDLSGP
jgi:hypothetical protein